MTPTTYNIDLQTFRTPTAKVFTGRPRGRKVRESSRIDELEPQYDKITVSIPNDISSINPSFLEEFFQNVILKLGESGFNEKFSFINEGSYKVTVDLQEAVERILREENALS